jgi:hydrocephalus-inducing protein
VKAEFKWDTPAYKKNFTITPESGYINPNSNLDLEVTFHPQAKDEDIRCNKVKCEIKGGETLYLTLMGKCIDLDVSGSLNIDFKAVVRKTEKKEITIQNTEDKEWAFNPTISTESDECSGYFIGKPTINIPPKQQGKYEITYYPKTMTKKVGE